MNHPIQKNEDDEEKQAPAAPPRKYTNRDIVYGRGSATRNLPGNRRFREVIDPFMKKYHHAKDNKEKKVALSEVGQVLKEKGFRFWTKDGEEAPHSQVLLKIRTRWTTQNFNLENQQISEEEENRQISSLALDIMKEIDELEKNNEGLSIEELVSLLDDETSLLRRAAMALDRQDQKTAASSKKKKAKKAGTNKNAADGAPPTKKRKVAAPVPTTVPTNPTAIKDGNMDTAGGTLADQDQKTLDTFKTTPTIAAAAKAVGFPQSNEQNALLYAVPHQQDSTSEQEDMSATGPPAVTVSPDSNAATVTARTKNFQGESLPFCIGSIPTRVNTSPKVGTKGMAFTQKHHEPSDFSSPTTRADLAPAPEATFVTEGTASFKQNHASPNMDTAVGVCPPSPSSNIFLPSTISHEQDDGTARIDYDMSILDEHHFEWNAGS